MPSVARAPVFEMAQAATGGRLLDVLDELRAAHLSYDRIAAELAVRYGLSVSGPTVKTWIDRDLAELNGTT